ncbi:MAG: trigger factor [Planctomycetaceae bacterium]|jgi:trigger factor|nr:trigger factor [Planctomycetaceae bacterium]
MSSTDTNAEVNLDISTNVKVISTCERVVEITIPQKEVERYFNEQFDELKVNAHIPGFRPGKAPQGLIEKKFRRDVKEQVKRNLINDALRAVADKIRFVPISEPKANIDSYEIPEKGPFVFEFSIEVRPEFELPEWKGLKIKKPVYEVKNEDINREITTILSEYAALLPINTPAEKGNYIETNIKSELDGVQINSRENEIICIQKSLSFHDGIIENFDKLIVGAKAGDIIKTQVKISDFAKNIDAQRKNVDVTFEILGVKQIEIPQLSYELLQRLGNFADEADLKDLILDRLKERLIFVQNSRIREQFINLLSEMADWELPPEFLAGQAEREFKRLEYELISNGYSPEYIASQENLLRQNTNEATAKALKEHFILERIAETENIVETEEDFNREVEIIARQYGVSARKMRATLEKGKQMDILRNQIIERKVLDLIAQHAKIEEVPFDFDTKMLDVEALRWSIAGNDYEINEASPEDLKAVHKEVEYKKKIDPNVRIT